MLLPSVGYNLYNTILKIDIDKIETILNNLKKLLDGTKLAANDIDINDICDVTPTTKI